ncbi:MULTISPECIES: hypothetical protein [unclassified Chryseobacterium]|uniref:hypothetical protein n=1 Tax=unclassified Chryseobacterium TaxID=2593645 RepID=UPI00301B62B1
MFSEIQKTQKFLKQKFGDLNKVPPGVYAIPTTTAVGDAFMRVVVGEDLGLSDFSLWVDEALTESWEEALEKHIPRKF